MAFENVFRGIDHSAPQRAEQARQQQFMEMLGQAVATQERQADRELKERQMEMNRQAKANAPINVEKVAENALLKQNMGMPLNEKEQGAIATMGQIAKDQIYTDSYGNQVRAPSPWRSMGGYAPQQQSPRPYGAGQGIVPEQTSIGGGVMASPMEERQLLQQIGQQPQMPPADMRLSVGDLPQDEYMPPIAPISEATMGNVFADVPQQSGMQTYQAPEKFGAKGEMMEEQSKQKFQEQFIAEKMKRKIKGIERFSEKNLASANFANRMMDAANKIEKLEAEGAQGAKTGAAGFTEAIISAIPSGGVTDKLGKGIVKMSANPKQQQYLLEAQDWIRAKLRSESGAVIGEQEMIDEYSTYFPTAGDSPEVIESKKEKRKQAQKGMITQSAGAYQEAFGRKAQATQNQQTGGWSIKRK